MQVTQKSCKVPIWIKSRAFFAQKMEIYFLPEKMFEFNAVSVKNVLFEKRLN